jgi:adenylate cyclase class 2
MATEYEAKFLNIPIDAVKRRLIECGAKQVHPPVKFYRAAFKLCSRKVKGYVRVRDEGNQVTMTAKIYRDDKFPEEYELTIKESLAVGIAFLNSLGLSQKAFQESFREKWSHPLAHEITFDILPGLPIYMEVDCTSETKLNQLVELLKLDTKLQRFGAFDKTYLEYYGIPRDVINEKTKSLTFSKVANELKPIKNKDLFDQLVKLHLTIDKHYKNGTMDAFFAEYKKIDIAILGGKKRIRSIRKKTKY